MPGFFYIFIRKNQHKRLKFLECIPQGAVEGLKSELSTCLLAASLVGEHTETLVIKLQLPSRESKTLFAKESLHRFYSDIVHNLEIRLNSSQA